MTVPDSQWLGYAAAVLTTGSFIPQAWLTLRTRDVRGISLSMYAAFTVGVALWLLYGLSAREMPIIVANLITLLLSGSILAVKAQASWRWRQALRAPADVELCEAAGKPIFR